MPATNDVQLEIGVVNTGAKVLDDFERMLLDIQRTVKQTATSFSSIDKSAKDLNRSFNTSVSETKSFNTALGRANRALGDVRQSTDRAENSMLDYSSALGEVQRRLAVIRDFGARQLTNFIQASSRLENVRAAYTSVLGSVEAADVAINKLRESSEDPGLTFEVAAQATQRFLAFGVSLNDAIQLTRNFANAAVVSGTSTAQLAEGYRQLSQFIGRGKAEQEDLNSLTERFGPIGQRFRQEIGKTGEEVTKSLEASGESVTELLLRMSDLGKQPVADATTLTNAISNLQNAFNEFSTNIGNVLLPTVKEIIEALTDLLEWFNDLPPSARKVIAISGVAATALAGIGTAAAGAAATLGTLTVAFGGAAGAGGLAAAATAGASAIGAFATAAAPIAGIVAAATGAVVALVATYNELKTTFADINISSGKLGEITSVTRVETEKADKSTKDFAVTLQVGAEAMESIAESAKNAKDAIVEYNNTVSQQPTTRPTGGGAPTATAPTTPRRTTQPSTIPRTPFVPIPAPNPAELSRYTDIAREAALSVREGNEKAAQAVEDAWRMSIREVGRLETANTRRFLRNADLILSKRQQDANHERALISLVNKDRTAAANRQFELLGDLDALFFPTLDRMKKSQDELTEAIKRSVAQYEFLVDGIREVFSTIDEGPQARGSGRTIQQLTGLFIGIGQLIARASGGGLFHDPANDLLAELAGARAVRGLPIGRVRAANRQSARDFADSFASGVEREARQLGRGTGEGEVIEAHIFLQVNDLTTQEIVKRINVMEQSGRTSLRTR